MLKKGLSKQHMIRYTPMIHELDQIDINTFTSFSFITVNELSQAVTSITNSLLT